MNDLDVLVSVDARLISTSLMSPWITRCLDLLFLVFSCKVKVDV